MVHLAGSDQAGTSGVIHEHQSVTPDVQTRGNDRPLGHDIPVHKNANLPIT